MISERMKYVGTASMSAAAGAWQSIWWISVAHHRPKVGLSACDLLQSFTTQVKYVSQFLPAMTVLRLSLNLIFVPFPMVPVFLYFSRVKPLRILIHTCCRSHSKCRAFVLKGNFIQNWIQCLYHASFFISVTSVLSFKSGCLFYLSLPQYLTCTATSWTVMGFVIKEWNYNQEEADSKWSYDEQ